MGPLLLTAQQSSTKAVDSPPIPMPQDRAEDSYRIYSMLVGEVGGRGWPHNTLFFADTTVPIVGPDMPCVPQNNLLRMNPHVAIQPPPDQAQDFAEMLEDFDRHCHDRILLNAGSFKFRAPPRLLTPAEQDEYWRNKAIVSKPGTTAKEGDTDLAAKYAGAAIITSFSEVFFNAHHTIAMVYSVGLCGDLCGSASWTVLALRDRKWTTLGWNCAALQF